jgi:REP-associated tyrosine transposase
MRRPRRLIDGARYHVIARANRKEFILESDPIKQMLLDVMARARERFRVSIDTICIMDNHVHLIIMPGKNESLSRIMQWILSVFAMLFNRHLNLQGHVWYDRFRSFVLGNLRQFIRTYLYIHENPVHAGMVDAAHEYQYCGPGLRRSDPSGALGPPGALVQILFPQDRPLQVADLR